MAIACLLHLPNNKWDLARLLIKGNVLSVHAVRQRFDLVENHFIFLVKCESYVKRGLFLLFVFVLCNIWCFFGTITTEWEFITRENYPRRKCLSFVNNMYADNHRLSFMCQFSHSSVIPLLLYFHFTGAFEALLERRNSIFY